MNALHLLFFLTMTTFSFAQISPILEPFHYKNRVVIVFTPTSKHSAFQQQLKELKSITEGLKDRDLVILKSLNGNTTFPHELNLTKEQNRHLRSFYGISNQAFTVILIGKDGTEKLRTQKLLTAQKLFSTIDAMPMRQMEMRRKQKN